MHKINRLDKETRTLWLSHWRSKWSKYVTVIKSCAAFMNDCHTLSDTGTLPLSLCFCIQSHEFLFGLSDFQFVSFIYSS